MICPGRQQAQAFGERVNATNRAARAVKGKKARGGSARAWRADPPSAQYVACCELAAAVTTLESQMRAAPKASMQPALVANLANLYQMIAPGAGGASSKPTLERLVMATADDDFDASVLNLGQ